jgi:putative flippase GtrA
MRLLVSFFRHPVSSLAATAVDFAVMIFFVSFLMLPASVGTAIGAACGATVNFLLGRFWVFGGANGRAGGQVGRYALVSLGSLVLNAWGVHVLSDIHHLPYIAARAAVSLVVSFGWNFVLHRFFVFGGSEQ